VLKLGGGVTWWLAGCWFSLFWFCGGGRITSPNTPLRLVGISKYSFLLLMEGWVAPRLMPDGFLEDADLGGAWLPLVVGRFPGVFMFG